MISLSTGAMADNNEILKTLKSIENQLKIQNGTWIYIQSKNYEPVPNAMIMEEKLMNDHNHLTSILKIQYDDCLDNKLETECEKFWDIEIEKINKKVGVK